MYCRFDAIVKVKATQAQVESMNGIVSKLKQDKDSAAKQVKEIESALAGLVRKIRVSEQVQ